MNENDILSIREIFRQEIKPLQDEVAKQGKLSDKIHQTVYGSDGEGGMRHIMSVQNKEIEELKTFRTQVKTIAVTVFPLVQAGITVSVLWIKSIFSGKG
jgi:hypothetical protein